MSDVETRRGSGGLGVVAAFLGGALVGGVLTLLLAPRSGAETRRKIVEQAERSNDAVARIGAAATGGHVGSPGGLHGRASRREHAHR